MSQTASAATGKPYGVERVCLVCKLAPRTTIARRGLRRPLRALIQGVEDPSQWCPPDDVLLELIRRDLAASPFRGEGHRKVCHGHLRGTSLFVQFGPRGAAGPIAAAARYPRSRWHV